MKNITNLFYKMFTETQLAEIRNYLLSKKLPIDILIEVNDHFVSQINDLQREENLSFEEAFEKTKENWKEEFKTTVPFYILANKKNAEITYFEKKIKTQNNKNIIITSIYLTIIVIIIYGLFLFQLDFTKFKIIHKILLVSTYFFGISTIFINLILNRFMYTEKYKNYRFSVYQWRTLASFSFSYLILIFLKPIEEIFQRILIQNYSFEIILKIFLFFCVFTLLFYTGIYHIKLIKTIKKVKPFLKYL